MSWSEQMVARAYEVRDEALPEDVLLQTKRIILDSIGCVFGAADSPTAKAVLGALPRLGSEPEVTLFGQSHKTSIYGALLYNGGLLRYLDLNDASMSDVVPGPGSHNSEFLPVLLAIAEMRGLTGDQVVRAMSHACDLAIGFTDAIGRPTLEERGMNVDLRAAFVVPIVAGGELMGLSQTQVVDAIGIALSRSGIVNILDSDTEENSMAKNLRFPLTAHMAMAATYLAEAGVTGPARVFEGHAGFVASFLDGQFHHERLIDEFRQYRVRETVIKDYAACYANHGHLTAIITLAKEHDLHLADVERILVRTTTRGVRHTGQEIRRNPTTKETADHSIYYLQAIALRDRKVGTAQYGDDNIFDPAVRALMQNVTVEAEPEFDTTYPAAEVTATLHDGRVLTQRSLYPTGHPKNPVSDAQVEEKYFDMTTPQVGAERAELIRDLVWRLEEVDDLTPLFQALQGDPRP